MVLLEVEALAQVVDPSLAVVALFRQLAVVEARAYPSAACLDPVAVEVEDHLVVGASSSVSVLTADLVDLVEEEQRQVHRELQVVVLEGLLLQIEADEHLGSLVMVA